MRAFNEDGRTFIWTAVQDLLRESRQDRAKERATAVSEGNGPVKKLEAAKPQLPMTFAHFVMNLPASAVSFLPHFRGVYGGLEELFAPHTATRLPMIHVYCFMPDVEDVGQMKWQMCRQVSEQMQCEITPQTAETTIWDVRDVSRRKSMYCVSFRLPAEVAFASAG